MLIRKTQLWTLAAALLFPIAAYAQPAPNDIGGTLADPDDNQQFQEASQITGDIVIDGDLSEWSFANPITNPLIGIPKVGRGDPAREAGEAPTSYVVHETLGGTWTGPEDQSTMMEVVWREGTDDPDEFGIYIGLVVTDDYHENAANSPWNGDSMQMMITNYDADLEEHTEFALYNFALGGTDDFPEDQIMVAPNLERAFPDFFDPPVAVDPEDPDAGGNVEVAITRDFENQQTFYEIRFGSEAAGLEALEEGAQFGLAMAINDGDEDVPGQAGWVGLGAHAIVFGKTQQDAALFTLGPESVGPVCDMDTMGDLDGSGMVDFADFLVLSGNFGNAATSHTEGDVDCSGMVDFADFLTLSANFGTDVGGAAAVPEPTSLGLFGFSIAFLGFLRRRRNR